MSKVVKLRDDGLNHYLDGVKQDNDDGKIKEFVIVYTTTDDDCVIVRNSAADHVSMINLKSHLELQIMMDMVNINIC